METRSAISVSLSYDGAGITSTRWAFSSTRKQGCEPTEGSPGPPNRPALTLDARSVIDRETMVLGVVRALDLPERAREGLPAGLLVELTRAPGAAATTAAVQLVLASQRAGDPAAWVQAAGGPLFPPDLATAGVDLEGLLVVHVPMGAGPAGRPKAAELLLRSGAFGAIVLDLESDAPPAAGGAWLGRLAALAREHACRCVLLAPPSESSLGPTVSLRVHAARRRVWPGRFALSSELLKDKSGTRPALPGPRIYAGPPGLP